MSNIAATYYIHKPNDFQICVHNYSSPLINGHWGDFIRMAFPQTASVEI